MMYTWQYYNIGMTYEGRFINRGDVIKNERKYSDVY